MSDRLRRLLQPRSVAIIGGGTWCQNLITQIRKFGFAGELSVVHPTRTDIGGMPAVRDISALPHPPDAAFVGVNRDATIGIVGELSRIKAGGAICFASGFREAESELADGGALQDRLTRAAGDMPILGPNCYGFINALDQVSLWPDQHGAVPVQRGVAIITQSSNIAINLTMQCRNLPIAYMVTAGNQAAVSLAEIACTMLSDPRVSALGLHIEGVADLRGMEAMASMAQQAGKPIVALKVGASEQARVATVSHTASLAGSDAGAGALLSRLGIVRAHSLSQMLETLRLMHWAGPLATPTIAMASCSGGEASLVADTALRYGLTFPKLTGRQKEKLRATLGPKVALANPLDYHTYVWGDQGGMTSAFAALAQGPQAITGIIVDFPRADRCETSDWDCVIAAAATAQRQTGTKIALIATLPEGLSETVAADVNAAGLVALSGLDEALFAISAAAAKATNVDPPLLLPQIPKTAAPQSESASKACLARAGIVIPRAARAEGADALPEVAANFAPPFVIKAEGMAHKSDHGGVVFAKEDPQAAIKLALQMPCKSWLVEEMVTGAVVELLVGVTCDPAHGYVLTIGAGGVLTEIQRDTFSLLVPAARANIDKGLDQLRIAPLLRGYRGQPAVARAAILDTIMAVQDIVIAEQGRIAELEINPLICTPDQAVAVDALLILGDPR